MGAKLVLKIDATFGKEHLLSGLRAFLKNLEQGIIKEGSGISYGSGLHEEWDLQCEDSGDKKNEHTSARMNSD